MLNKVLLMGRLTHDPEIRTTQSGKLMVTFSIAVERDFTPQGQTKETDFINCVAWSSTADFIGRYFSKGSMIAVCGSLQIRSYTDRDGNNKTAANVVVETAYFTGEKRSEQSGGGDGRGGSGGRNSNRSGGRNDNIANGRGGYSSRPAPKPTFTEMEEEPEDLPF